MSVYELLARLPDPDVIGQSEYRAVYELLSDGASGYEADSGLTPAEYLDAMLDQIESSVRSIRKTLETF